MKNLFLIVPILLHQMLFSKTFESPGKIMKLTFETSPKGEPVYSLLMNNRVVIGKSTMGIVFSGNDSLFSGFNIISTDTLTFDEVWNPVWGEESRIRNCYREVLVTLQQTSSKKFNLLIRFRIYDDGLGFRYEIPKQGNIHHLIITDEITNFQLTGNHKAFWIPGDYDSNEYAYITSSLSEIDAMLGKTENGIGLKNIAGPDIVQSPLTMVSNDKMYICIFEASLHQYPAMYLHVNKSNYKLTSHLVPDALGNKAYISTPFESPWRVVIAGNKATDILDSRIVLNLNEPCKITDVSWIKPMKYVGIWWEMHIGKSTWNYADTAGISLFKIDWKNLNPNGKHGATTLNMKKYIDFASLNGFDAVLAEGWNIGWEDWFGTWKEDVFDFITPYPDFDIAEIQRYAAEKKVQLIMHHETSASVTNYERYMDTAYRFMKHYGYTALKTGYVGGIIPRGEYHDGQWMIGHYERVAAKTAENKIALVAHEPVRPTGMHRTYPNLLACEAARGNEFNAWSNGNPPEHETILPFTRLLGGPMDYTPGIFNIKLNNQYQVHTTLCKQLALYLTMYSPIQMAADLPENYLKYPDAFRFIKEVAVDWEKSIYIDAEPGDFITVARKEKNTSRWFIGAITDENPRTQQIKLSFIDPNITYTATIWADKPDAHWKNNPKSFEIQQFLIKQNELIELHLAAGGGAAVILCPANEKELKTLKKFKK